MMYLPPPGRQWAIAAGLIGLAIVATAALFTGHDWLAILNTVIVILLTLGLVFDGKDK